MARRDWRDRAERLAIMGKSYAQNERGQFVLACDGCGAIPARSVPCPFTYPLAEGGDIHVCGPDALCQACRPKYGTKAAHRERGCERQAITGAAEEREKLKRAGAGTYEVVAAWGDWHEKVPAGMVGVMATPGAMRDAASWKAARYFLVPAATYSAARGYVIPPDAIAWSDPD